MGTPESVLHELAVKALALVEHEDGGVRSIAIEALSKLPSDTVQRAEVVDLLFHQLESCNNSVLRLAAVSALGRLPPTSLDGHAAAICKLLSNPDPSLRQAALSPLSVLPVPALATTAPTLLAAVYKLGENEHDLETASAMQLPRELLRLPVVSLQTHAPMVVGLLDHSFGEVRHTAVKLISRLAAELTRQPHLVSRMVRLCDHSGERHSPEVRCAALGALGALPLAPFAAAAPAVLYRLGDPDPDVRSAALRSLAQHPVVLSANDAALAFRLQDADADVREAGVDAVAALAAWASEAAEAVAAARAAAEAAAEDGQVGMARFGRMAIAGEEQEGEGRAEVIRRFAVDGLTARCADAEPSVRVAALEALETLVKAAESSAAESAKASAVAKPVAFQTASALATMSEPSAVVGKVAAAVAAEVVAMAAVAAEVVVLAAAEAAIVSLLDDDECVRAAAARVFFQLPAWARGKHEAACLHLLEASPHRGVATAAAAALCDTTRATLCVRLLHLACGVVGGSGGEGDEVMRLCAETAFPNAMVDAPTTVAMVVSSEIGKMLTKRSHGSDGGGGGSGSSGGGSSCGSNGGDDSGGDGDAVGNAGARIAYLLATLASLPARTLGADAVAATVDYLENDDVEVAEAAAEVLGGLEAEQLVTHAAHLVGLLGKLERKSEEARHRRYI